MRCEMERRKDLELVIKENLQIKPELRCYIYSLYNYPIHIFCAKYPNGLIQENWEYLNEKIAFILQTKLSNPVEQYNIYLLIFEQNIEMELRLKIENNRYCCRKIVIQKDIPNEDESLMTLIENRLFSFEAQEETMVPEQSVQSLLCSADSSGRLLDLVVNIKSRVTDYEAELATDLLTAGEYIDE